MLIRGLSPSAALAFPGGSFHSCIQRPYCSLLPLGRTNVTQSSSCWREISGGFAEHGISVEKSNMGHKGSSFVHKDCN